MLRIGTRWLATVVLLSLPAVASAESAIATCLVGAPLPESGEIPRNQPGFVVPMLAWETSIHAVELELWQSVGDAEPVQLASTTEWLDDRNALLVTPDAPLTVGATVELRGQVCRFVADVSVIYRVVDEEAQLPAPPLRLESRVVGDARDGFFVGFRGEVDLHVDGGGVLAEWVTWVRPEIRVLDRVRVATVDGRVATASFPLACEGFSGVVPGNQRVQGSVQSLHGEALGAIEEEHVFACADARFVDTDSGRELSAEEAAELRHAPAPVEPEVDAGGAQDAGPDDATGKGGCSTGGTSTLPLTAWGLVAWLVARRRRPRR
ncbi:MAG: hypothetical protein H6721_04325 [Sandaracinus sp.]|nr:hypothetical protein [Myxococcales bacterium]MCB9631351.1 hypothetical protein [Sandaracinus sp.]